MISVITPCLDNADVIGDCVSSVKAQNVELEHLLVDGESTDGTPDCAVRVNADVRVVFEPARGIYAALNRGIEEARGDIVGVLNADDFYAVPEVLEWVSSEFTDPSVDTCYGDLCYVSRDNPSRIIRYWRAGEFSARNLLNGWMPPHPTFFVRRNLFEKYGTYRQDLGTAADYELMLRLLFRHQVRCAYIPKILVKMRTGGASNASLASRLKANRMDRRAWEVNGLKPRPWTLLVKPLRKIPQWWQRPATK